MTTDMVPMTMGQMALRDDTFRIMAQAYDLAQRICKTEFVPTGLRNRPEAALAAILTGREMGLTPMVALRHIDVIEGQPSLDSLGARALVQSKGHSIWADPEPTATRCVMHLQRRGESHIYTVTWTADDVRRAGLANRPNHQKYPRQMLIARATGDVCRLGAADLLAGIGYLKEEIEGGWVEYDNQVSGANSAPSGASAENPPETPKQRRTRPAARAETPPAAAPEPNGVATATASNEEVLDGVLGKAEGLTDQKLNEPAGPQEQLAGVKQESEHLSLAQRIAILCEKLKIERYIAVRTMTGKERGSLLTREEAGEVLENLKAIDEGRATLDKSGPNGSWRFYFHNDLFEGLPLDEASPTPPED